MTYALSFLLGLGPAKTGLSDLRAQLIDTAGAAVGSAISTGFVEIGTGYYSWYSATIPDSHRGGVKFYSNAASSTILAVSAINPEEAERLDAKVTLTATAAELLKVPKSDSNVTWNATALASINAEVDTALNTAIPGSPTADSLNQRIAAIDTLTEAGGTGSLAAILTDTAELQTDWTNGGRLDLLLDAAATMGGTGAITFTYTLTNSATGLAITTALVEVFTDATMLNLVASGYTNSSGVVVFYLNAGTYYLRRSKSGFTFTNPDTEVVA